MKIFSSCDQRGSLKLRYSIKFFTYFLFHLKYNRNKDILIKELKFLNGRFSMSNQRISTLLALSLISSPIATIPVTASSYPNSSTAVASKPVSQRASVRRMTHQLAVAPQLKPMGTYVGELQERWQFPSDHLPIGMTCAGHHFASWNVLDAQYMSWVTEKNSQGLSRSMIADEHVYIGNSGLTVRDKHIADLILQMISHPTHPRSLLTLQECSEPFIEELRSRLPAHFEIISNHGDAVLLDRSHFEVIEAKEVAGIFADSPSRTVQDILIHDLMNEQPLRLVNAHLPGDPTKPARFEFTQYLNDTFDPHVPTIAMGDMNFNELEMSDAMRQSFENDSPFSVYSPYCTNISPGEFTSKAIDHFIVYSPSETPVLMNSPNQILRGLSPMVSLLEGNPVSILPVDDITLYAQQNCINEGTLQKTREYVYLQLNQDYLTKVFNKIKETEPDVQMPGFHGEIGPHISIVRHDEWKGTPPEKISEIGAKYLFTPVRIEVIQTEHKRLWTLVVSPSSELTELREKYAVGDLPHGHEFHITMAQQFN
jgi:endonuclease/exonuclease/phosphatase family metal-dependent hydrolase